MIGYILVLAVVVLAFFLFLKVLKGIFKLFVSAILLVIILTGVLGLLVYSDFKNFQDNFENSSNVYFIADESQLIAGFEATGFGDGEKEILSEEKIASLQTFYETGDYDGLLENHYKLLIFKQELFSEFSENPVQFNTAFEQQDECKKREIIVSNVPTYGENTVAEHAFALLLSISRKIPQTYINTLNNNFSNKGTEGFDLRGKIIGIIGGGNIGMHLVRMAKGFEMEVLVFDIFKREEMAKKLGFKYVELDDLLKNSDVISFHVPLNKHTHHLVNKESINKMKKGVVLINTSRGGVVESKALLDGLKSGKIGFAGLDVVEEEKHLRQHEQTPELKTVREIIEMENVIFTPHNAFNSREAMNRRLQSTYDNIEAFRKGKPQNVVNS
jgi:D-lactate dehydrogenase